MNKKNTSKPAAADTKTAEQTPAPVEPKPVAPKVGRIANHRNINLDPRPITRIEGNYIWLQGPAGEMGPFHVGNYTFQDAR